MRKYNKFSIVLEISQKKWWYNKKFDCTGNLSKYMNEILNKLNWYMIE